MNIHLTEIIYFLLKKKITRNSQASSESGALASEIKTFYHPIDTKPVNRKKKKKIFHTAHCAVAAVLPAKISRRQYNNNNNNLEMHMPLII